MLLKRSVRQCRASGYADFRSSASPQSTQVKLACISVFLFLLLALNGTNDNNHFVSASTEDKAPLSLAGPFSPSNARTESGDLIPENQFFPASRCATCHRDTHTAWSESLHRNAARDPFYRESADILLRTRGIESTRHCESCHTPVALFSGALTKEAKQQQAPFTPFDDEGVTCSVCHSIVDAQLNGTGSYTIRRPALLAREDGSPIYGDFTDEQILADVPAHKRAVMRPLLRKPEFCSVCHKVDAPAELNGYKHIRGFSAYDEWQQSGASHETITPFYRREMRADCRACHMPKVESRNDRAAKSGMISSHRWLGANTATPIFYDQTEQARLTEKFLQSRVLDIDIFAIRDEASGTRTAPLEKTQAIRIRAGEEITVEVVVSNAGAAHSFPPEVRDLYEAWVEFEVVDRRGEKIFHSGFIQSDGMLDQSAHVYKTIILDEQSRPITRHQIWLTNIKAYDNAILPGRSDVARFRFRAPEGFKANEAITLRARVNYRRFNQEYTDYVLKQRDRKMSVPVVMMAEAEAKIVSSLPSFVESRSETAQARRWNDYGIALLDQAQYGDAAEAFRRASELDPTSSNFFVNRAIAEMRTERFSPEREQITKAAALLDRALAVDPANVRAQFYRALVMRAQGKRVEAADELARIAAAYPRDREVQRQLGQTQYGLGRIEEARRAFESVLEIDPTDAGAYQFLIPIYLAQQNRTAADRARALYLGWRDDPLADSIAARFFAANPQWSDERVLLHWHGRGAPPRPVLTGQFASPVK